MKKLLLILLCFNYISGEKKVIDKTLAVVYHTNGSTVILQSDLRPGLEGTSKTLRQVILDKLIAFDGENNFKITISPEDVDRHLIQVQKQFNLTKEDTLKLFKDMGFSQEEAREQLRLRLLIDNTIDYRVRGKCIVDKKVIENYYNEHPIRQDASFVISQAFVPFEMGSKTLKKITIKDEIDSGDILKTVSWSDPVELKANQFADDKAFVKDLEPGSIVQISETEDGITLLRLISKQTERLVPLEDRIKDITSELSKDKFNLAFADYQNEIMKKAHIKYMENPA